MESAESSDVEPITLKEIKKIFAVGKIRNIENLNITKDAGVYREDSDASFCLIKSHSQPNLRPKIDKSCSPSNYNSPAVKPDDSFIQIENMVSELCKSPTTSDNVELNDTFDVIDYILNHPPIKEESEMKEVKIEEESFNKQHIHDMKTTQGTEKHQIQLTELHDMKQTTEEMCQLTLGNLQIQTPENIYQLPSILPDSKLTIEDMCQAQTALPDRKQTSKEMSLLPSNLLDIKQMSEEIYQIHPANLSDNGASPEALSSVQENVELKVTKATPINVKKKEEHTPFKRLLKLKVDSGKVPNYFQPAKILTKKLQPATLTPRSLVKTPNPKSSAKPSALTRPTTPRNTPSKVNSYKHIASPVASYIKNCPQVAIIRNVRPKKPLPGTSCIPKLRKSRSQENLETGKKYMSYDLPFHAYKSSKKTEVIQEPDENKLPESPWSNKLTNTFPKATVIKHEKRINLVKKVLQANQDNSIGNLSCYQAEVSVCTEKTAFKTPNK